MSRKRDLVSPSASSAPPKLSSSHHKTAGRLPPLYLRKRTFPRAVSMSALGHNRTHAPEQTAPLFDNLVSARTECGWKFEAERLRGLEIDDQLEFDRLQHGKVRWCRAIDNFRRIA